MTAHRVLVVGGGYSGVLAALRIARKGGARVAVTLVNPRRTFVERVRLHQMLPRPRVQHQDLGAMLEPSVRFVEGQVAALDGAAGRATIEPAPGGRLCAEPFDTCLIATGSVTDMSSVPGAAAHAAAFGTAESASRARARLVALPEGARVVVVGGGLTAIEVASELAEARPGLRTALVTAGPVGLGLSRKGRAVVARHMATRGVAVHEHTPVTQVDGRGVVAGSGARIDAELVFWAAGMKASALPRAVGLPVDDGGRAWVDDELRAQGQRDVFVVGDSARIRGHDLRMGCVVALPMAIQAADQIVARLAGRDVRPFRFRFVLQCIGLGQNAGLIQMVGADDAPRERVLGGRFAGFIKEAICRYAGGRPGREARAGWWPGGDKRALPAIVTAATEGAREIA